MDVDPIITEESSKVPVLGTRHPIKSLLIVCVLIVIIVVVVTSFIMLGNHSDTEEELLSPVNELVQKDPVLEPPTAKNIQDAEDVIAFINSVPTAFTGEVREIGDGYLVVTYEITENKIDENTSITRATDVWVVVEDSDNLLPKDLKAKDLVELKLTAHVPVESVALPIFSLISIKLVNVND